MMRFVFCLILAFLFPLAVSASDATVYSILFLTKDYKTPPPLSLLKKEWTDEGLKGAEFSAKDGDLAGRLFKKSYVVVPTYLSESEAISALSERDDLSQYPFIIADLHRDDLLALAALPETQQTVIFNIREKDDTLRTETCLQNVFHLIPSRAMYADALGQYLKWKRWQKWFLVQGKQPADRLFAKALTRTADRYGADIVETRDYQFEAGNRRMETGHQQIQTQMPMATQGAPDHDVLVVADESEAFGLYLGYRSKSPRPVVGTQGMFPTAWHRSFEQYGAARLQKIYEPFAGRGMTEKDYLAWLAVKQVVAFTLRHQGSFTYDEVRQYLRDPSLKLAGYKGRPLNFRPWNQQLRQPIILTSESALISMSPIEGFLHPTFHTDTLGYDEPESACRLTDNQGELL